MTFTLRVPVRTLGKEPIPGITDTDAVSIGGTSVKLEAKPPHLAVVASGFATQEDAEAFLPRAVFGLWALVVRWNVAFRADLRLQRVQYTSDPVAAGNNLAASFGGQGGPPVDALIDISDTVVYRSDARVRWLGMGEVSAIVQTPPHLALPFFKAAVLREDAAEVLNDPRLCSVLDLFNAYFYETSLRAKFLTLVMILEVLAPAIPKHPRVQQLIGEFKMRVGSELTTESDTDTRHALDSLDRELTFRRETSIRRRVRQLLRDEFADETASERERLERDAVEAYDARGTLVHTGTLPDAVLSDAQQKAWLLVRKILGRRLGIRDL
jgi:hypothetical protein